MLHQTGDFRGQAICWCHWHLHHGDENVKISHKISHNSANVRHSAKYVAPMRGLSMSYNLSVSQKFDPCCMATKIGEC